MKTAPDVHQNARGPGTGHAKIRLGDVEVRPRSGVISGPGGERKLDPRVMDVLLLLIAAEGRVVTRADLMAKVWEGMVVTDFALSRCIYQLRKNLCAAAGIDDPPIETLPKRGYRLLWRSGDPPGNHHNGLSFQRWSGILIPITAMLLVVAFGWPVFDWSALMPEKMVTARVAVLPLEDLSDHGSQRVFAKGLTAEIIHGLDRIDGLTVVGRMSSGSINMATIPALVYAKRVDADYLLSGSVESIGDSRRVLVYLQRMPEGEQLWNHAYMVEREAPFTVVNNIVLSALERMQFVISPGAISGSTQSLAALEQYLAAFEADSYESRKRLLEKAVELDPEFARAWDLLAGIEVMPVWNGEKTVEEAWERARPHVERALAIEPKLANAYITLGRFEREFGDLDAAAEHFRHALELEPGNVWASGNLGLALRMMGQYREALEVHQLDVLADPLSPAVQARLGTSNWFVENNDEAERRYRMAAELDPGYEETYDSWAAMLALGRGQLDQSLEMIKRKMTVEVNPTARTYAAAVVWSRALGLYEEADEYERLGGQKLDEDPVFHLAHSDPERAREVALGRLAQSPDDAGALLVLASLEIQYGVDLAFSERVFSTFPDLLENPLHPHTPELEVATVYALACVMSGRTETASALLRRVLDMMPQPLSPQHYYAAAAYAMLGETDRALDELQASPPGWIRVHSAPLPRDPRFRDLWGHPGFEQLLREHKHEIQIQREHYLARLTNLASAETPDPR